MRNIKTLIVVIAAVVAAFLLGRCTKKPTVVEKVVEKTVWPDDIPMPEPVVVEKWLTRVDVSGAGAVAADFDKYRDSVEILLAARHVADTILEVRFIRDTFLKEVIVEVPVKSVSDTVRGENYVASWTAEFRGRLDRMELEVEVDCPLLEEKNQSIAFGSGFRMDVNGMWDVPFSVSHEKDGFEKGLTWHPRGQALTFDTRYRFKYKN